MGKYRKKPIVIEATQFNRLGDHPAVHADEASPTGAADAVWLTRAEALARELAFDHRLILECAQ